MNEEQEEKPDAGQQDPEKVADESRPKPTRGLSLKVSEKGALSVYGLGRFPVTLYKEQWLRLLGLSEDIRTFIRENDAALKSKAQ